MACSWRSWIGKDSPAISEIDSAVFTKQDKGDGWEFSFALRRQGRWYQQKTTVPRTEGGLEGETPTRAASKACAEILDGLKERLLRGTGGR